MLFKRSVERINSRPVTERYVLDLETARHRTTRAAIPLDVKARGPGGRGREERGRALIRPETGWQTVGCCKGHRPKPHSPRAAREVERRHAVRGTAPRVETAVSARERARETVAPYNRVAERVAGITLEFQHRIRTARWWSRNAGGRLTRGVEKHHAVASEVSSTVIEPVRHRTRATADRAGHRERGTELRDGAPSLIDLFADHCSGTTIRRVRLPVPILVPTRSLYWHATLKAYAAVEWCDLVLTVLLEVRSEALELSSRVALDLKDDKTARQGVAAGAVEGDLKTRNIRCLGRPACRPVVLARAQLRSGRSREGHETKVLWTEQSQSSLTPSASPCEYPIGRSKNENGRGVAHVVVGQYLVGAPRWADNRDE